jgi:nucleoside-diphosphate-sugar epimerase
MRVAVTGASGFVGGRTARALESLGHEVWSFGRRPASALPSPPPRYATWDITRAPIDLRHVHAVVHCAAHVAQWGAAEQFAAVNERGTMHLLASLRAGVPVVHVSTASVYDGHDLPPYAASKQRGEAIVTSGGHPAIVLRPHVIYGPGDTTLWPRVRARVRRGRLYVPGHGRSPISVTHIDNLVQAITLSLDALRSPSAPRAPLVLDVADADTPRVDELLRTLLERYGERVQLRFVPEAAAHALALGSEALWTLLRRSDDPPLTRYVVRQLARPSVLDIGPAREQLGYLPRWTYRDGPL